MTQTLTVFRKNLDALCAALCTALSFHTRDNTIRNSTLNTKNHEAKMTLYKDTMAFLVSAAAEANQPDFASRVDVCRDLFVQLTTDS
jgi:hypothetical protein